MGNDAAAAHEKADVPALPGLRKLRHTEVKADACFCCKTGERKETSKCYSEYREHLLRKGNSAARGFLGKRAGICQYPVMDRHPFAESGAITIAEACSQRP